MNYYGYGYGYGMDFTYILVILGVVICGIASLNVKSTYAKYSKIMNARGYTAQDVAAMILKGAGIYDVTISRVGGDLTDHYSPKEKVLRLSDTVYDSRSVAAIGVAAHECGHAIQHAQNYMPLSLRSAAIPVANIGSTMSYPIILIGLLFGLTPFVKIGAALFALVVFVQFVTLPVEFNASARALKILQSSNILEGNENKGAKAVLTAAALTYVAALVSSLLQLTRLLLLSRRRRN
ncbi:MAG: zinc metallopeptidase [Lachnospiraceae bacterium]|nr:zinc metallopeptidase [Lachnospiraceae bacterium]